MTADAGATTPPAGDGGSGGTTDTSPPPECKVPVDVTGALPAKAAVYQNRVTAVPDGQQGPEAVPIEQLLDRVMGDYRIAMTRPGWGYTLPRTLSQILSLSALRAKLVEDLPADKRPFNGDMIPEATNKTLVAFQEVPGGQGMAIDVAQTEQELNRVQFCKELYEATSWFPTTVQSNQTRSENILDKIIRDGVKRVSGLFSFNSRLLGALAVPLKMIGGPAQQGADRRKENEQLISKVKAEGQDQHDKTPPAPQPPSPVITVTTQGTPPAAGTPTVMGTPSPQLPSPPRGRSTKRK